MNKMTPRDLSLSPRKEHTREIISIKIFDIDDIEKHFRESLQTIDNKFQIAKELKDNGKLEEAKDIWRTQIIFLESAFDFYMHEIIKLGIINMFNDEWNNKTDKYMNLTFTMRDLEKALTKINENDSWLKEWINEQYSSKTMMSYTAFKNVCKLLDLPIKNIADSVFYERDSSEKTIDKLKNFIDNLYHRRNLIAHQSDRRMEDATIQNIEEVDVQSYIKQMKNIVVAIGTEIKKKV